MGVKFRPIPCAREVVFGVYATLPVPKIEPTFFLNLIRMEFNLPTNVKTVSEAYQKKYKKQLDFLALSGYDTVEKIAAKAEEVVELIENATSLEDDVEKAKQKARLMYSAIFYAMYDHPMMKEKRNPLRDGFHRNDPSISRKGEPWQKIKY